MVNKKEQAKIARFESHLDKAILYCYRVPEQKSQGRSLGIRIPAIIEQSHVARFEAYGGGACLYCERNPFPGGGRRK